MNAPRGSLKQLALNKANTQMVIFASIAAFVAVFALVASNYLWKLYSYQSNVIHKDIAADNQLRSDVMAANQLSGSYYKFATANPTIIGTPTSNTPYLYNNATVVLDALPSQYDFPATMTSVQKLFNSIGIAPTSITGTDSSSSVSSDPSPSPSPVSIPFTVGLSGINYSAVQQSFNAMEHSIRPMQVDTITLSGSDSSMDVNITAHSYFQPPKQFSVTKETVSK